MEQLFSEYRSNCVTVLIWEPNPPQNAYGHAAIQTDKYHMSFWPDGKVDEMGRKKCLTEGVPASLVFHHLYDKQLEGKRPATYTISLRNVDMEMVNMAYEELLNYNGVPHSDASLDTAEELIEQIMSNPEIKKLPSVSLNKTLYSFWGNFRDGIDFINGIIRERDFYKYKQSCTTFCLSLLLYQVGSSDDDNINRKMYNKFASLSGKYLTDVYTVPQFLNIIKKVFGPDAIFE